MSRRFVLDPPFFHLFCRTERGRPAFRGLNGMFRFEAGLADLKRELSVDIYAYCLMPTHWHLVIQVPDPPALSRLMAALKRLSQAPFDPIGTRRIASIEHFRIACEYVEANPVEARYAARPAEWRLSSAWRRPPQWLSKLDGIP